MDEYIEELEQQLVEEPNNRLARFNLTNMYLSEGKIGRAIYHAMTALEIMDPKKIKKPNIENMKTLEKLIELNRKKPKLMIREISEEARARVPNEVINQMAYKQFVRPEIERENVLLRQIIHSLFKGDLKTAEKSTLAMMEKTRNIPGLKFLLGQIYEILGEDMHAATAYQTGYSHMRKQQALGVRTRTETRNEIELIKDDFLAGSTLISKIYRTQEQAKREYFNTLILHDTLQELTSLPLIYIDPYKQTLFRVLGIETLDEKLPTVDELLEAAKLLAKIEQRGRDIPIVADLGPALSKLQEIISAATGTKLALIDEDMRTYQVEEKKFLKQGFQPMIRFRLKDPAEEDPEFYTKKMKQIFLGYAKKDLDIHMTDQAEGMIIEGHAALNEILIKAPKEFYSDHNLRNLMRGLSGHVKAIDFESDSLQPPQLDLVSMLEFGSDYVSDDQKKKVIRGYLRTRTIHGMWVDEREFLRIYKVSRVVRHLEMVGYRSRDCRRLKGEKKERERKMKKYHLEKAKEAVLELPVEDARVALLQKGISEVLWVGDRN